MLMHWTFLHRYVILALMRLILIVALEKGLCFVKQDHIDCHGINTLVSLDRGCSWYWLSWPECPW